MINQMVNKLDHLIQLVSHILLILSGILVLVIAFSVTYGVIRRYAFHSPDSYVYDISTIFLLFCAVLSVAGVERLNRHIQNDILSSRFPLRLKYILLDVIFPILALLFCVILTWKSTDNALYALKIGQVTNSSWALPLAPVKFVIPLGYALLCLILMAKLFRSLVTFKINFKKKMTVPVRDSVTTEE